ncbi:MAG: hypothetical protein LUC06_03240, partial [Oscillospiraceae bacterium]|nr:hypothetical protein [Oscillospiraceae bacterium]
TGWADTRSAAYATAQLSPYVKAQRLNPSRLPRPGRRQGRTAEDGCRNSLGAWGRGTAAPPDLPRPVPRFPRGTAGVQPPTRPPRPDCGVVPGNLK